ncbi:MAG: hypothetical protein J5I93_25915 [Pirellulaceae bacterium]|nr:hypothetical protein [Pirellulaceae bacterium]
MLSADGRYAVRINRFGDCAYASGGTLSWGLKFYERGVEIKSHDVADLIDYPSLMEFTSSDWHFLWYHDFPEVLAGRYFDLSTSTRDTYRFDVTTGEIVEEQRFWRNVARASIVAVVAMAILGGAWSAVRIHKRSATPTAALPADSLHDPTNDARKRSYGLRSLFVVMTTVAIFCWIPHVATFALTIVLAVLATRWSRRRMRTMTGSSWQKSAARMLLIIPGLGWFLCYTLSLGPTLFLVNYFRLPHDVRQVLLQVPYAPLLWLSRTFPVESIPPLDWYLEAWS